VEEEYEEIKSIRNCDYCQIYMKVGMQCQRVRYVCIKCHSVTPN
jgi:hypothetical protein